MFEDAQEFVAMRASMFPGRGSVNTKLMMRCTANSQTSINETYVPAVCYDSRGCCNTARAAGASSSLDAPISSTTTLDANALLSPMVARVDEQLQTRSTTWTENLREQVLIFWLSAAAAAFQALLLALALSVSVGNSSAKCEWTLRTVCDMCHKLISFLVILCQLLNSCKISSSRQCTSLFSSMFLSSLTLALSPLF